MQGEAKKKVKRVCYGRYLRQANKAVTEYYNKILEPSGLTNIQLSLLKNLREMGIGSVSDLADLVELDRTTVVRGLKPLFDAGYVEDHAQPGTRNRQLQITEAGSRKVDIGMPMWQMAQEGIEKKLGKDRLQILLELLSTLEEQL